MKRAWILASLLSLWVPSAADAQGIGAGLSDPSGSTEIPASPTVVPPPPADYGVTLAPEPVARPARPRGGYSPTWALLVPGLAAFVSSYASAALAGLVLLTALDEGGWMFVPIVGPWVLAADVSDPEGIALLTVLGIVEAAGIALIIAGLAINRRAGQAEAPVTVVPLLGPDLVGLGASGRF